jgi:hypothetical protein
VLKVICWIEATLGARSSVKIACIRIVRLNFGDSKRVVRIWFKVPGVKTGEIPRRSGATALKKAFELDLDPDLIRQDAHSKVSEPPSLLSGLTNSATVTILVTDD